MATDAQFIAICSDVLIGMRTAIRRGQISGFIAAYFLERLADVWDTDTGPTTLHRRPTRFAVPKVFNLKTGQPEMTTFAIRGDLGTRIPLEFDNLAGSPVPEPSGTPTVASSNEAVATVQLDSSHDAVDIFPVQPPQSGVVFTISFTLGSLTITQDCEITPDLVATQGHFNTSGASTFDLPLAPTP